MLFNYVISYAVCKLGCCLPRCSSMFVNKLIWWKRWKHQKSNRKESQTGLQFYNGGRPDDYLGPGLVFDNSSGWRCMCVYCKQTVFHLTNNFRGKTPVKTFQFSGCCCLQLRLLSPFAYIYANAKTHFSLVERGYIWCVNTRCVRFCVYAGPHRSSRCVCISIFDSWVRPHINQKASPFASQPYSTPHISSK